MHWDVVIVGSGAAGLSAAVAAHDAGASVLVLEKSTFVGGTTALSGGVIWIPGNDHMAELGMTDSPTDALTYLRQVTCGREPDAGLLQVYVDAGAAVLRELEASTPLPIDPGAAAPAGRWNPNRFRDRYSASGHASCRGARFFSR